MIKIISTLLNSQNSLKIDKETVGELLKKDGVENLWEERTKLVDTIIIHYTSAVNISPKDPFNLKKILEIFISYGVSAHYLILRDGAIYNLVPEDKKAWHAGLSKMATPDLREGVNDFSIGIELAGVKDEEFTENQYNSLSALILGIKKRYEISTILGHEDVAGVEAVKLGIRKDIKIDPGPKFDWSKINL